MSVKSMIKNQTTSFTYTENGALCLSSSGNALVDLYSTIGALRSSSDERKYQLFDAAVAYNKELATKTLFYGRDIREGLGERDTFRKLLAYAANKYKEIVAPNIPLIGFYGRFDDLYCLLGTDCEDEMWQTMKNQFEMDLDNMKQNKPVSLLAKWIKTPDASSENTRKLGILTSQKLGYPNVKMFKKDLKALRKYLDILEIKISANDFESIAYNKVPSNAMNKYRKIFSTKDSDRFNKYLEEVAAGKTTIHADTLYPYDIVKPIIEQSYRDLLSDQELAVLEAQWKALPNYVEPGSNILVMVDTSGSMHGNPIAAAVGLGMYFAERNTGAYHNKFMTFSQDPELLTVTGNSLKEKVANVKSANWNMNTDVYKAMDAILNTAIKTNAPKEAMPKALVIISDMQFDQADTRHENTIFYDRYAKDFIDAGYEVPNIIFWNVNASKSTFHADANNVGVQFASGYSASTFKNIIKNLDKNSYAAMLDVLLSDRYDAITVA